MEPLNNSVWYREFLAEREEILCYKWIESEKAGFDIGFERALLDWTLKYRSVWIEKRSLGAGSARMDGRPPREVRKIPNRPSAFS